MIEDLGVLESLAGEWSLLCDRCPSTTPFQRPEWLLPWCRHFGPDPFWAVALRRAGQLAGLGLFFIYTRPNGSETDWQEERVLAPLGLGNSDYLDVLVEPGIGEPAMAALVSVLASRSKEWDVCDLGPFGSASPLLTAHWPEGWQVMEIGLPPSPVLELPDRVEDLDTRLPHRQAKNLRQFRRRAEKLGDLRSFVAAEGDYEALLTALMRLHGARWNSRGLPGVLVDPTMEAFYRDVAVRLARRSSLALHGLSLDGDILGVYYGFYEKGGAYFYLHGFSPEWARWSPGVLLVGFALEEAVRRGATFFDFLGGTDAYKYLWGAIDRPNSLLRLNPPRNETASS